MSAVYVTKVCSPYTYSQQALYPSTYTYSFLFRRVPQSPPTFGGGDVEGVVAAEVIGIRSSLNNECVRLAPFDDDVRNQCVVDIPGNPPTSLT